MIDNWLRLILSVSVLSSESQITFFRWKRTAVDVKVNAADQHVLGRNAHQNSSMKSVHVSSQLLFETLNYQTRVARLFAVSSGWTRPLSITTMSSLNTGLCNTPSHLQPFWMINTIDRIVYSINQAIVKSPFDT